MGRVGERVGEGHVNPSIIENRTSQQAGRRLPASRQPRAHKNDRAPPTAHPLSLPPLRRQIPDICPSTNFISNISSPQLLDYFRPIHEAKKAAVTGAPTRNCLFLIDDSNLSPAPPINEISLSFPTRLMLSVQHFGPVHEAHFLWGFKAHLEQDTTPILVSSPHTPLTTEPGSMALPPAQARCSSRRGRGLNGRDVQLDKLGDLLAAPTRQTKKRFAPSDELSLPNNLLAPVQKKRQRRKVLEFLLIFIC